MLDKLCRNSSHLEERLKQKLNTESELNIVQWLKQGNHDVVEEWQKTVAWLRQVSQDGGFQCDTFALAVHILDTFLGLVKIHGKYLKCAATTSCYIAVKVVEEKQTIPTLNSFLLMVHSKFTANDIHRMEKIILQKSGWDLSKPTAAVFLEIYFSLLCANHFETVFGSDSLAYSVYRSLAGQLELCYCATGLTKYKGSMKALGLLSCTLEKITSRWFLYIEHLANISEIDIQNLLNCRDIVKVVIFGIPKKTPKLMRPRKFARRRSLLSPPRAALSPIVENPFEWEFMRYQLKNSSSGLDDISEDQGSTSDGASSDDIVSEEVRRLRRINIFDTECSSPAKRRKLVSCGRESRIECETTTQITSPVHPLQA